MKLCVSSLIGLVLSISVGAEPLLEGRVLLSSGQPVAGVQVRLFDLTDFRRSVGTTTDEAGHFALPLQTFSTGRGAARPAGFALGQNYPNPFNPSTIIPYQLPASGHVRLDVFNMLGQRLATLVDAERSAGAYTAQWDGTNAAGQAVGAGVYIYRLSSGGVTESRRMVLVDGQAGIPAAGATPEPVWSVVEGSVEAEEPVYGLTVSGEGLVPYVDPAFRVGLDRAAIVVEPYDSSPRMKAAAGGVLGDVNGDGSVDLVDALFVMMYSIDSSALVAHSPNIALGDVDTDGDIDVSDAYLIMLFLLDPSDPALPPGIGLDLEAISGADEVSLGSSTAGSLSEEGEVDYFRIEMSSAGSLVAYTTGSTDTYGAILDSSGNVLAENDDGVEGLNFRVSIPVSSGTYYIQVRAYEPGDYTLHVHVQRETDLTPEIVALYGTLVTSFQDIFFAVLVGGESVEGEGGGSVEIAGNDWTFEDYSPDGAEVINGTLNVGIDQDPIPLTGTITLSGAQEAELTFDMQITVGTDGLYTTGTITIDGVEFDVAELTAATAAVSFPSPEESLLWQYRTDNPGELVIVSPTVADGVVYAGSHEGHVYALDAETGELLWSFETASDLEPPPLVADGVVFAQDLGGFYALDASTGKLLWSGESEISDAQVSDGTVYIPTRGEGFSVSAVDAISGEQMWATEVPHSFSGFLIFPLTLTGKNIYVSDDDKVHALDATTGELAWTFRAESPIQTPPTSAGGKVYMMVGYEAHVLDEATGEPLWSYEPVVTGTTAYLRPPVVVDGVWYLSADELHALDAETGQRLWSSDVNYPSESPVVADGMVFVTDILGALYALNAATGAQVWSLEADWNLTTEVQIVDGILYAHSLDGSVHTFDARTGESIWSLEIGYHWYRQPVAVSGGVLYVGYQLADSGVYAFTTPSDK